MQETGITAFIGLGSNLGDGRTILQEAWKSLASRAGIYPERLSSLYLTAPVGMESRHWFSNAAGRLRVMLPPLDLLRVLMEVEADFGRVREGQIHGYRDRSLDLDLLYYGSAVMYCPELTLPHPRIGQRLFVLTPLSELEPSLRDPLSGETIAAMAQRLNEAIGAGETEKQEIVRSTWEDGTPQQATGADGQSKTET